jgi:hypothetical protein
MVDEVDNVAPAREAGIRVVGLKVKTADLVDEYKVTVVVGRGAQFDRVAVRGVTTDVEVIPHVRTDEGSYDYVASILDKSDGNEYGADNIFMVPAAATRRGVDVHPPIWGKSGDPSKVQLRQEVAVALPVDKGMRSYPGGERILARPPEGAVGRRNDAQGRVDAADAR